MPQTRHHNKRVYTLHNADTDPGLPRIRITQPIPAYHLPGTPEPWHRRLAIGVHQVITFVIRKIILAVNFALALLLLVLFSRFLLTAFSLHASLFSSWTFQISNFLLLPFNNLLPILPYQGLFIDTNALVAIIAYTIIVKLFTAFLNSLLGTHKKKAVYPYP